MWEDRRQQSGRSRQQRRRSRKMLLLRILLLLMGILLMAGACFLKMKIEPNLEEVAKLRAQSLVSGVVNRAIHENFSREMDISNLLIRQVDEKGQVDFVQANTKTMNLLVTEISKTLQKEYAAMKEDRMRVPVGTLLGSKIWSQAGPETTLKVIPYAVSSMDFKTELESQGINQTKYRVYIRLKSQVKVMAPFSDSTFELSNTILVAEAIILGGVPDSYVVVPEEDILDVT